MAGRLPDFVEPMLAKLGQPFDSDEHWFEIKWDGIRALAFVEGGAYRLVGRSRRSATERYPELAFLGGLPPGTVLDGELVALTPQGLPDFRAVLSREQARTEARARVLARATPVTYVVFDVLYTGFESRMALPLRARRELLAPIVEACEEPRLVLSDGIVGRGRALFGEVDRRGIEGILAKRLDGAYLPGRRSDSWTKIKIRRNMPCVILGYQADETGDLRSLVIGAVEEDGELRCVGKVGSGLTDAMRAKLLALLRPRVRPGPLVECGMDAVWVEPDVYCAVAYLERTSTGNLRAPVFVELLSGSP